MARALCILVFTAALLALAVARQGKHCDMKSCRKGPHTLCNFSPSIQSPTCDKVLGHGLNKAQIAEILAVHNKFRDIVASGNEKRGHPGPQPRAKHMGHLTWSPELAETAQAWANQCKFGHDLCRNTETWLVGQNVASSSVYGQPNKSLSSMITSWYDEVKDFNKNLVKQFPGKTSVMIGHYTQMVWAKTTHIGCGFITYNNEDPWITSYLVCNYGPAGNMLGEPVYEQI